MTFKEFCETALSNDRVAILDDCYRGRVLYPAKACVFNFTSGFMLYQWFNGSVVVEQFVHSLPEWCKAAGITLDSIIIID